MKKIINLFTHRVTVVPPIDKELLVARHPSMVLFFSHEEQITILSRLWYKGKLSTSQCIELNASMDAVIDDIIATCNML